MVQSMNNNPEEKPGNTSEATRSSNRKSSPPSTSQSNSLGGGWKFESPDKSKSPSRGSGQINKKGPSDDFGVYSDLARAKTERDKILKPEILKHPSPNGIILYIL